MRLTNAVAEASNRFRSLKRATADELAASDAVAYGQTRTLAVVLSVGAVLLALSIGLIVSRSILRPVRQVASAARKLAVGELQQELQVHSHDELGQMADAFRAMVVYQNEMACVATDIAEGNLFTNIQP